MQKNWLFAGSLRSGQRAVVIMSLIQLACLNELDMFAYLSDVIMINNWWDNQNF